MASKFEQALAAAEAAANAAALAVEDSDAATRNSILAEYNELEVRAALAADGASPNSPATDAAVALAVRYKKDPLTGCCRIPGCKVQLVSRRLKYLWPFKPFVDKGEKHHCRACKLKVCAAHFTRSAQGMKVCTVCFAAGVDGPDLGKAEGEEEDAEEREAVAGGALAPPSPAAGAASPAAGGGGGGGGSSSSAESAISSGAEPATTPNKVI